MLQLLFHAFSTNHLCTTFERKHFQNRLESTMSLNTAINNYDFKNTWANVSFIVLLYTLVSISVNILVAVNYNRRVLTFGTPCKSFLHWVTISVILKRLVTKCSGILNRILLYSTGYIYGLSKAQKQRIVGQNM